MNCDGETLFVDERLIGSYEVDEAWLAMTDDTQTAYLDVCNKLDEAGRRSCDGKTFQFHFPSMADLIIPEDILPWLAMTLPTRKAWNTAVDKLKADSDSDSGW